MNLIKYFIPFLIIIVASLAVVNPLLREMSSFWIQIISCIILAFVAIYPFLRKETNDLTTMARWDKMSNLYRRETFIDLLDKEIARSKRHGHTFSLIVMDLDHFKQVNDVYGHLEGDKVIEFLGKAVNKLKRDEDIAGRLGGEEFGLFLPETSTQGALTLTKRIQGYIKYKPTPKVKELTMSAGIAECPTHSQKVSKLLNKADKALYKAKEKRDEVVIYSEEL